MKSLTQEILSVLQSNGFDCSIRTCNGLEFICTYSLTTKQNHTILPLSIEAGSVEEASCLHENTKEAIRNITSQYSEYPLIVTEDRWHLQPEAMQKRILAHLEIFNPIYARNCEVRRIDKASGEVLATYIHGGGNIGVIVAANGADNDENKAALKNVAMQVAAMNPVSLCEADVPEDIKASEFKVAAEKAREEGKPEAMIEKIAMGRMNKFYKEACLLNQEFIQDSKLSVAQYLQQADKECTVTAFKRFTLRAE